MNKLLEQIFERSVDILKQDTRCLGGWHFGSISRNQDDEYSDIDPVFLINDEDFNEFDSEIPDLFQKVSDKCILIWPEEFNSKRIKNYAVLIEGENDSIVQYDFTIINKSYIENPFSKIFYKGCSKSSIIFDKNGDVNNLLNTSADEDCNQIDILYQIKKYWLFCFLTVKYYKRKDILNFLTTCRNFFIFI